MYLTEIDSARSIGLVYQVACQVFGGDFGSIQCVRKIQIGNEVSEKSSLGLGECRAGDRHLPHQIFKPIKFRCFPLHRPNYHRYEITVNGFEFSGID